MKYEEWIRYEEARLAEQHRSVKKKGGSLGAQMVASYRERHLVEVLLQQQALIDALKTQIASLVPGGL
jgi:hypothetical protein